MQYSNSVKHGKEEIDDTNLLKLLKQLTLFRTRQSFEFL